MTTKTMKKALNLRSSIFILLLMCCQAFASTTNHPCTSGEVTVSLGSNEEHVLANCATWTKVTLLTASGVDHVNVLVENSVIIGTVLLKGDHIQGMKFRLQSSTIGSFHLNNLEQGTSESTFTFVDSVLRGTAQTFQDSQIAVAFVVSETTMTTSSISFQKCNVTSDATSLGYAYPFFFHANVSSPVFASSELSLIDCNVTAASSTDIATVLMVQNQTWSNATLRWTGGLVDASQQFSFHYSDILGSNFNIQNIQVKLSTATTQGVTVIAEFYNASFVESQLNIAAFEAIELKSALKDAHLLHIHSESIFTNSHMELRSLGTCVMGASTSSGSASLLHVDNVIWSNSTTRVAQSTIILSGEAVTFFDFQYTPLLEGSRLEMSGLHADATFTASDFHVMYLLNSSLSTSSSIAISDATFIVISIMIGRSHGVSLLKSSVTDGSGIYLNNVSMDMKAGGDVFYCFSTDDESSPFSDATLVWNVGKCLMPRMTNVDTFLARFEGFTHNTTISFFDITAELGQTFKETSLFSFRGNVTKSDITVENLDVEMQGDNLAFGFLLREDLYWSTLVFNDYRVNMMGLTSSTIFHVGGTVFESSITGTYGSCVLEGVHTSIANLPYLINSTLDIGGGNFQLLANELTFGAVVVNNALKLSTIKLWKIEVIAQVSLPLLDIGNSTTGTAFNAVISGCRIQGTREVFRKKYLGLEVTGKFACIKLLEPGEGFSWLNSTMFRAIFAEEKMAYTNTREITAPFDRCVISATVSQSFIGTVSESMSVSETGNSFSVSLPRSFTVSTSFSRLPTLTSSLPRSFTVSTSFSRLPTLTSSLTRSFTLSTSVSMMPTLTPSAIPTESPSLPLTKSGSVTQTRTITITPPPTPTPTISYSPHPTLTTSLEPTPSGTFTSPTTTISTELPAFWSTPSPPEPSFCGLIGEDTCKKEINLCNFSAVTGLCHAKDCAEFDGKKLACTRMGCEYKAGTGTCELPRDCGAWDVVSDCKVALGCIWVDWRHLCVRGSATGCIHAKTEGSCSDAQCAWHPQANPPCFDPITVSSRCKFLTLPRVCRSQSCLWVDSSGTCEPWDVTCSQLPAVPEVCEILPRCYLETNASTQCTVLEEKANVVVAASVSPGLVLPNQTFQLSLTGKDFTDNTNGHVIVGYIPLLQGVCPSFPSQLKDTHIPLSIPPAFDGEREMTMFNDLRINEEGHFHFCLAMDNDDNVLGPFSKIEVRSAQPELDTCSTVTQKLYAHNTFVVTLKGQFLDKQGKVAMVPELAACPLSGSTQYQELLQGDATTSSVAMRPGSGGKFDLCFINRVGLSGRCPVTFVVGDKAPWEDPSEVAEVVENLPLVNGFRVSEFNSVSCRSPHSLMSTNGIATNPNSMVVRYGNGRAPYLGNETCLFTLRPSGLDEDEEVYELLGKALLLEFEYVSLSAGHTVQVYVNSTPPVDFQNYVHPHDCSSYNQEQCATNGCRWDGRRCGYPSSSASLCSLNITGYALVRSFTSTRKVSIPVPASGALIVGCAPDNNNDHLLGFSMSYRRQATYCPNDCRDAEGTTRGRCQVATQQCICNPGYIGPDCSAPLFCRSSGAGAQRIKASSFSRTIEAGRTACAFLLEAYSDPVSNVRKFGIGMRVGNATFTGIDCRKNYIRVRERHYDGQLLGSVCPTDVKDRGTGEDIIRLLKTDTRTLYLEFRGADGLAEFDVNFETVSLQCPGNAGISGIPSTPSEICTGRGLCYDIDFHSSPQMPTQLYRCTCQRRYSSTLPEGTCDTCGLGYMQDTFPECRSAKMCGSNCSGNGQCVLGKGCRCNEGWYGVDCELKDDHERMGELSSSLKARIPMNGGGAGNVLNSGSFDRTVLGCDLPGSYRPCVSEVRTRGKTFAYKGGKVSEKRTRRRTSATHTNEETGIVLNQVTVDGWFPSDYVRQDNISRANGLDISGEFTMMAWVKLQPNTKGVFMAKVDSAFYSDGRSPPLELLLAGNVERATLLSEIRLRNEPLNVHLAVLFDTDAQRIDLVVTDPSKRYHVTDNNDKEEWLYVRHFRVGSALFDGSWRHFTLRVANIKRKLEARVFIDGESPRDSSHIQCIPFLPPYYSTAHKQVSDPAVTNVMEGNSLLWGYRLSFALDEAQVYDVELPQVSIATVAGPEFLSSLPITRTQAVVLLCICIIFVVVALPIAVARARRGKQARRSAQSRRESVASQRSDTHTCDELEMSRRRSYALDSESSTDQTPQWSEIPRRKSCLKSQVTSRRKSEASPRFVDDAEAEMSPKGSSNTSVTQAEGTEEAESGEPGRLESGYPSMKSCRSEFSASPIVQEAIAAAVLDRRQSGLVGLSRRGSYATARSLKERRASMHNDALVPEHLEDEEEEEEVTKEGGISEREGPKKTSETDDYGGGENADEKQRKVEMLSPASVDPATSPQQLAQPSTAVLERAASFAATETSPTFEDFKFGVDVAEQVSEGSSDDEEGEEVEEEEEIVKDENFVIDLGAHNSFRKLSSADYLSGFGERIKVAKTHHNVIVVILGSQLLGLMTSMMQTPELWEGTLGTVAMFLTLDFHLVFDVSFSAVFESWAIILIVSYLVMAVIFRAGWKAAKTLHTEDVHLPELVKAAKEEDAKGNSQMNVMLRYVMIGSWVAFQVLVLPVVMQAWMLLTCHSTINCIYDCNGTDSEYSALKTFAAFMFVFVVLFECSLVAVYYFDVREFLKVDGLKEATKGQRRVGWQAFLVLKNASYRPIVGNCSPTMPSIVMNLVVVIFRYFMAILMVSIEPDSVRQLGTAVAGQVVFAMLTQLMYPYISILTNRILYGSNLVVLTMFLLQSAVAFNPHTVSLAVLMIVVVCGGLCALIGLVAQRVIKKRRDIV